MIEQPAADFPVKPTLTGGRVVLRPFLLDQDADALREMLQDPEAIRLTGSGHSAGDLPGWDDTAEAKFRGWYGTRNAQPDRLDLAVVDKATGQAVGEAVLNDWNHGNHSCSFRILLGSRGRDRGLGTEATRLIVGHGFERLRLNRVELQVYAFNPRGPAGLRERRIRRGGRAARDTALGWHLGGRDRDVHPGQRVEPAPRPPTPRVHQERLGPAGTARPAAPPAGA